jgi:16S rRNA (guanine(966)-N(2))-methyltransferase RsmD
MRVIAGRYKGRRLQSPSWTGLRPTSDRLKESLFAILTPAIEGARVLDGFAGSGAIGIEALSRGAAEVTFIDADRRALDLVRANLDHCGIADGYAMIRDEFAGALARLPAQRQFDLILLDPPYDVADLDGVLRAAAARLADDGMVVLEHGKRRPAPLCAGAVPLARQVTAGGSTLTIYRRAAQAAPAVTEDV